MLLLWNVLFLMDNKSVRTLKFKAVIIALMLECTDVHCCDVHTDVHCAQMPP